jgi:DNA-directed RNA polymerase specialized sigma24 family protein
MVKMNTKSAQEASLIDACIKGDQRAMQQFYERYFRALWAVAARYARDEQETKIILNQGMLKAFQSLSSFDRSRPILP